MSAAEPDGCYDVTDGVGGDHTCLLDAGHDRPGPAQSDHACTCGATWAPAAPLPAPSPERRTGTPG